MNTEQAIEFLKTRGYESNANQLRRLARLGRVPHYRTGKVIQFSQAHLEFWLDKIHCGPVQPKEPQATSASKLTPVVPDRRP